MSDKDRFILRLNPKRRARWDEARGNLPLSTWIKLQCDDAADAALGKPVADHETEVNRKGDQT